MVKHSTTHGAKQPEDEPVPPAPPTPKEPDEDAPAEIQQSTYVELGNG